jgi:hypothetical protein
MAPKSEDSGMWINPKFSLHGGKHRTSYGEGQNTHNTRFLELAEVVLSLNPSTKKEMGQPPPGLAIVKTNLLLFRPRVPVILSDSTHHWSFRRHK